MQTVPQDADRRTLEEAELGDYLCTSAGVVLGCIVRKVIEVLNDRWRVYLDNGTYVFAVNSSHYCVAGSASIGGP